MEFYKSPLSFSCSSEFAGDLDCSRTISEFPVKNSSPLSPEQPVDDSRIIDDIAQTLQAHPRGGWVLQELVRERAPLRYARNIIGGVVKAIGH